MRAKWPIAAIIVVGAIVGGLVYGMWQVALEQPANTGMMPVVSRMAQPTTSPSIPLTEEAKADEKTSALSQVGSSTEVADIEKDLQGTDLTGLDAEMNAIGSEAQ